MDKITKRLCGVYQILCLVTGKRYIGSTVVSFGKRWTSHLSCLTGNIHHCRHLQYAWNKYGESNFVFEALEILEKDESLDREQIYLDTISHDWLFNSNYSVVGGEKKIVKRRGPQTEETKKKISDTKKSKPQEYYDKIFEGRIYQKRSKEFGEKMKEVVSRGEEHHFFGKTRNSLGEWVNMPNVVATNVISGEILTFGSTTAMSKAIGVSRQTINGSLREPIIDRHLIKKTWLITR